MWKHPLLGYIKQVKSFYECNHKPIQDWNFKHWLEDLSERAEKAHDVSLLDLLDIFEPLDMTVDNEYVLFHYKGFIDLSDMNYSEAEFFYLYDGLYRECRSCVFDVKKEEIVLASLPKWKNYNEDAVDWSEKNIRNKYTSAQKIWITNKMDGSYQQFRYITNSDGSGTIFGSGSQAINLNESWRLKEGFGLLTDSQKQMIKDYPDYTFIFEFISTKNAIVVHYTDEQEGMYLISARSCIDGTEMDFDTVRSIATLYDSKMVEYYDSENLDSLLAQVDNFSSDEKEGWVIRMRDENGNDYRVKIKTTQYVALHRFIAKNISPNIVIKSLDEGWYDDLYSKIPVVYQETLNNYKEEILNYLKVRKDLKDFYLQRLNNMNFFHIKQKLIWVEENVPVILQGDLYNSIKGKELNFLKRRGYCYRYVEIMKLLKKYNIILKELKNDKLD